jgi:hypothetical protein
LSSFTRLAQETYPALRDRQQLNVEFEGFIGLLIKLLNSIHTEPNVYFGILQLFPGNRAKLDFVQNLQYKYIDLVSLELEGSPEEEVKESITFRYNVIKAKLSYLQNKFKQFSTMVKTKNPSLMVQMQKTFKSGQTGVPANHNKSWKPI